MVKTKYKNRITGKEVEINDVYMNDNGAISLIEALYENSSEWIKIFPVDESNIMEIADFFTEEYCKGLGTTWTEDFKKGFRKGIAIYIESINKK